MKDLEPYIAEISQRLKEHGVIFPYMGLRRSRPKGWKTILVFVQYGQDRSYKNPAFDFLSKEIDTHGVESFVLGNWGLLQKDILHIESGEELVTKVVADILEQKKEVKYA